MGSRQQGGHRGRGGSGEGRQQSAGTRRGGAPRAEYGKKAAAGQGRAPRSAGARSKAGNAAGGRPAGGRPAGMYIEGRRAAAEALRTGFPVKRALVAEGEDRDAVLSKLVTDVHAAGIPVLRVPRAELDGLSSHGAHQGIALEVGAFPYAELADVIANAGEGPALVVVLDHVTDAGNFGAIVRSAEVVGAAGVVIASKRAAEVTVATYKTSAGAVMHLPIARVPNIARALEELKGAGFWTVGASEHAEGVCWDAPLSGRIALVMGSEGDGLSRLVLETCDDLTKLPQHGKTESLNVAQAATALCYEWLRQNSR
ncbi:23S rRNA (guanosine(2251)-2'-O)-methyltransferase RlmB [Enorma phocaeensis]|uniref:23S rRNA (guanosine(2251)-2'-O)-methyltransferase RlmB n=1 Tax=Enorma phocaeensis TaxID=1871019 RepID=UPI000C8160BB